MRYINDYIEKMELALDSARDFAELFHMNGRDSRFSRMAEEELEHAKTMHEYTEFSINRLKETYTPPADMQRMWDLSHREYIEQMAYIKQMLDL